jgi:trans-aconitate 2-methyltransferase
MENISQKSKDYYDQLWVELERKGLNKPNSRHYAIISKLKKYGLRPDEQVIELGCGAGALSILISKYLTKGKILAADLSEEIIKLNQYKYKKVDNLEFLSQDITKWTPPGLFDSIILPDVIEHIPLELHDQLWKSVNRISKADSKLFINIPHPKALEYLHETNKDILQEIDLPISLKFLSESLFSNNFYIEQVESYSLGYTSEDYQFIVARKNDYRKQYEKKSWMNKLKTHYYYKLSSRFF